ncbi:hypothetical protein J437_LFUL016216 [Ladona fulva]|uniref:Uncharacterized protein n=1 Tax=Ladona fulva TaxID=123851 RepID=A0A8K0P7P6_LADFU|nr:hypothetical protein J437_LFUL016216 [Ladona fulva]
MTSKTDCEDVNYERLSDLLKANHELTKDVCMLKQLVYCLNSQLGRYQKLYFLNQKSKTQNFPPNVIPPLPENSLKRDEASGSSRNVQKEAHVSAGDECVSGNSDLSQKKDSKEEISGSPLPTPKENVATNDADRAEKFCSSDAKHTENWDFFTLPPLLDAYEETIKEKDFIIREYERKMLALGQKCRAVVLENEALHNEREKLMTKTNQAGVSRSVSDRIFFLEEQNKLLKEFLDLEKDKLKEIQDIYEDKISDLTTELNRSKEEHRRCIAELSEARGRCNFLADEVCKLRKLIEDSIPMSVHNESELKAKYERDNQTTLNKLKEIEEAKMRLMNEVAELSDLKTKSERLMKTKEHLLRKSKQKLIHLYVRLSKKEKQNGLLRENLHKAVSLLEDLSMENYKSKEESIQMDESSMQHRVLLLRSALQTFQYEARRELDSIERRLLRHKKKKSESCGNVEMPRESSPIT